MNLKRKMRWACFTHCSKTVTLRGAAQPGELEIGSLCPALPDQGQITPRSAPSSLSPVGERNEVCGLEKEEEAKAAAANGNAV